MDQATIIIDTREQTPLNIQAYPTIRQKLDEGDYGIVGHSSQATPHFTVERKTLSDLVGSLTKGRDCFMREMDRMKIYTFAAILIEGTEEDIATGNHRSRVSPKSVFGTLDAIMVRYGVNILWAGNAANAAVRLETCVRHYMRGIEKERKS